MNIDVKKEASGSKKNDQYMQRKMIKQVKRKRTME